MTFGDKIKLLRTQNNISQTQLANQIGVSLRTIINYEKHNKKPKKQEIYDKLADALKTDASQLLDCDADYISITKEKLSNPNTNPITFLVSETRKIFSSDAYSDNEKLQLLMGVQESFFKCKNKRKK